MLRAKIKTSVTKDHVLKIEKAIRELASFDVLVGVPEEKSSRPGETVTNAELAFIHTNGSPIKGIPARPFIEPAIEDRDNRQIINEHLKSATEAAMDGDKAGAIKELENAGAEAQEFVRDWFTNPKNNWPPLSPVTIAARARRKYKSERDRILNYSYKKEKSRGIALGKYLQNVRDYVANGVFNPLIDIEELRKSIIWVIRKKD